MLGSVLKKVFGTKYERDVNKLMPLVEQIKSFEPALKKLSDAELKAKTDEFRQRLRQGETTDDLLPEAFAVVKDPARRRCLTDENWNMVHFDVQLIGGIVLHQGKIAEMKTGEGKTLVATLPAYLNALSGDGVHIVTVNDYLALRDREWMAPLFEFLGLTVGCIHNGMTSEEKRQAYACDITYGTNNEYGFDYLRDNMANHPSELVQRKFHYAIVDEVDSILIDEARTPLIISGPAEESTDKYYQIDQKVKYLKKDQHFTVEEKDNRVTLTEEGVAHMEEVLNLENLYDDRHMDLVHHINQSLKAYNLFKRDVDYVVKDDEVLIVDEFTGRLMAGRRYSDGLHQALEAKEGVKIENENQTLATITFQNYFRLYDKLAGMTGTAETEASEFHEIYKLGVVVIPTHMPLIRQDHQDVIYRTEKEKFDAVIEEIIELHQKGQPTLVGTISIENSEKLSKRLKRKGVKHNVLNAKYHEQEAEIISLAGQPGAVTIATNMAGRGTDIVLGDGVKEKGGLHIIGTERHESRRIDNQLRGRSGRQGDPGSSRFYISLEDDLMRLFGSERIASVMTKLGMEEGEPIIHPFISKAIETAQRRVESHNFEIRKHLLDYDDVMNRQREVIYEQRAAILFGENLRDDVNEMIDDLVEEKLEIFCPDNVYPEEWDWDGIKLWYRELGAEEFPRIDDVERLKPDMLAEILQRELKRTYDEKANKLGPEAMNFLEHSVLLHIVDSQWKDNLYSLDRLKEGINLRAYAQRDPLVEYQHEAYQMFQEMISRIREESLEYLFKIQLVNPEEAAPRRRQQIYYGPPEQTKSKPVKRESNKVGRNDPCPCGSGKKFKKCCMAK